MFNAEMRSRMNLSAFASQETPAEAIEVAWTACLRARERGYLGWAISAAGNACTGARALGAWDRTEAIAAELDALGEWANPWDFAVAGEVGIVRAYRGRVAEARELLERFDQTFGDVPDPQLAVNRLDVRECIAFVEGDLGEAIRIGREIDALVTELGVEAMLAAPLAIAAEARDRDRVAEIVDTFRSGLRAGRISVAVDAVAEGALRALDGDRGGLAAIDAGSDVLRSAGVRFDLALVRRLRALLVPDDPGAADAAREATAILAELGAATLLRGLPAVPDASGEPDPGTAAGAAEDDRGRVEARPA